MGRPLEFDKEAAVERAMDVFWEKGYEASSLDDLTDAMDLSRSSFYQAFENKRGLYVVALDHYTNCMVATLSSGLDSSASGVDFIKRTFLEFAQHAQRRASQRGCFLMNTATEFAQTDEKIAIQTKEGLRRIKSVFVRALDKAVRQGEVSSDKNIDVLADYLVSSLGGLKTMIKAGVRPKVLTSIVYTIISVLN